MKYTGSKLIYRTQSHVNLIFRDVLTIREKLELHLSNATGSLRIWSSLLLMTDILGVPLDICASLLLGTAWLPNDHRVPRIVLLTPEGCYWFTCTPPLLWFVSFATTVSSFLWSLGWVVFALLILTLGPPLVLMVLECECPLMLNKASLLALRKFWFVAAFG